MVEVVIPGIDEDVPVIVGDPLIVADGALLLVVEVPVRIVAEAEDEAEGSALVWLDEYIDALAQYAD